MFRLLNDFIYREGRGKKFWLVEFVIELIKKNGKMIYFMFLIRLLFLLLDRKVLKMLFILFN